MKPPRLLPLAAATSLALLACNQAGSPPGEPAPAAPSAAPGSAVPAPSPSAAALPSLGAFEGEIGLRFQKPGADEPTPPITVLAKAGKLRFGVPADPSDEGPLGGLAHVIVDGGQKRILAVSDAKQMVMVLPLDQVAAQMERMQAAAPVEEKKPKGPPPKVARTGKSDSVAGRACDEWEITHEGRDTLRLCVASERAGFLELPTLALPAEQAWARELFDGQHLPLRVTAHGKDGIETLRLEVTRIEPKALADAMFAAPAGYKQMDLGQMMAGVGAALGLGAPAEGEAPAGMPGIPPHLAGKLPPNFQAMMAKMRAQAMAKAGKDAPSEADGKAALEGAKPAAAATEKPAKADAKAKAKAETKAKAAAEAAKREKPAE